MTLLLFSLALLAPQEPDPATAAFVSRLRAARDRNERLVTAYTAIARQRIGVGLRAISRDRVLYRQELVARIEWRRDTSSTVTVIGAREGVPVALRDDRLPEDLESDVASLVLNPAQDYLRPIGGPSGEGFVYPLRDGAEADYAYAAGDTTVITLPAGRSIRLAALHVVPRRPDWRLLVGTLWFDAETHGLVRLAARPARPYEVRRDADPETRSGVAGFVNPTAEVRFITIEYGLYEGRWWMPRFMAIEAVGTVGSWLGVPLRIERVYDDYTVEGGTPPPAHPIIRPAGTILQLDPTTDSVARRRVTDSLRAAVEACVAQQGGAARARARCRRRVREPNLEVIVSSDTTALLHSPELGAPLLAMADLLSPEDLAGLAEAIRGLPNPLLGTAVALPQGLTDLLANARYNRIEGLSLGVRGRLDHGPVTLLAAVRLGMADRVLNGELAASRRVGGARITLGTYRRLVPTNPEVRPFGLVNSGLALLAQRDDGEYYRAHGVELTGQDADARWWSARVYVQREGPALVQTQASFPHLLDRDRRFRPNLVADRADQVGGALALRRSQPISRALTAGGELRLDGAAGDFGFARAAATLRLFITPAGPLAGGVAASAGTSTGTVPRQSQFSVGGAPTLRGYSGGVLAGEAFWTARAEVGNSFPAARLLLFSDVGWAGPRRDFGRGWRLLSAGVGASLLDGLLRLDLARALRPPTGWRLEFYLDGVL